MNPSSPHGRRVERVRHELHRRDVRVVDVAPLGSNFARITFAGETLDGFRSLSFDDHVKFVFDADAGPEPVRRDYTPRRFDPARRELTIEFALHGDGPAAEWARTARVGQAAVIAGPRGSMVGPVDYDWHLLAGDASALPAVHRRLEELPASTRALVVLQGAAADRRALASRARLELQWADDTAGWLQALRTLALPDGEGFVWCAGESTAIAQVRRIVLDEKRHPREHARIAAYWKRGSAGHHEA